MRIRGSIYAAVALGTGWMLGCGTPIFSGESAYCGDPPKLAFYYATFARPNTPPEQARALWTSTRRVVLEEPLGIEGEAITDLRLVELGSSPSFAVGGAVAGARVPQQGGQAPQGAEPWRLDVALTSDAASKLSDAVEKVAGSYQVIALVVGDEVFSASVDLPVRFGVARIEFPENRSLSAAREFFRTELGCSPASE